MCPSWPRGLLGPLVCWAKTIRATSQWKILSRSPTCWHGSRPILTFIKGCMPGVLAWHHWWIRHASCRPGRASSKNWWNDDGNTHYDRLVRSGRYPHRLTARHCLGLSLRPAPRGGWHTARRGGHCPAYWQNARTNGARAGLSLLSLTAPGLSRHVSAPLHGLRDAPYTTLSRCHRNPTSLVVADLRRGYHQSSGAGRDRVASAAAQCL